MVASEPKTIFEVIRAHVALALSNNDAPDCYDGGIHASHLRTVEKRCQCETPKKVTPVHKLKGLPK